MSPLAGPVAAAAVILAPGTRIPEVDDLKRLDVETRERLAPIIKQRAVAWAVAFAEVEEIDCLNIYWAGLSAMRRAIAALAPAAEHLLIDGRKLRYVALPQQRIVGGDAKSLSIAAASILAKTTRDARMRVLDAQFPGYGFAQHKGYPVSAHARALKDLGACPVHRRSFALVREVLGLPPLPPGRTFPRTPIPERITVPYLCADGRPLLRWPTSPSVSRDSAENAATRAYVFHRARRVPQFETKGGR